MTEQNLSETKTGAGTPQRNLLEPKFTAELAPFENWEEALQNSRYPVDLGEYTHLALDNVKFSQEKRILHFGYATVEELGFPKQASQEELFAAITAVGAELCPPDAALALYRVLDVKELESRNKYLHFAMESVPGMKANYDGTEIEYTMMFGFRLEPQATYLALVDDIHTDYPWLSSTLFVYVVPSPPATQLAA